MAEIMDRETMDQVLSSAGRKRPILIGAGVAAICAAVYFSYQAAPPEAEGVSGTMSAQGKVRQAAGGDEDAVMSSSGAATTRSPADGTTLARLQRAATVLGMKGREMSARPGEEGALGAEIGRAATEIGTTVQQALDGRVTVEKAAAAALERRTTELNGAAGQAERDPAAVPDARKKAAALARAAMAARAPREGQAAAE